MYCFYVAIWEENYTQSIDTLNLSCLVLKSQSFLLYILCITDRIEISDLGGNGKEQITAVTHDQVEPSNEGTPIAGSKKNNPIKNVEDPNSEGNKSVVNGQQHLNNNIGDNKTQASSDSKDLPIVKKEKPSFEEDDPFAALDWKDGIATLPGIDVYMIIIFTQIIYHS